MKFTFEFSRRQAQQRADTGAAIRSAVVEPGHAKVLKRLGRRGVRMYDAAFTDRLSADFPVSLQSANAEIFVSALQARSRARRLERDNPYAWAGLNAFQNNVVGDNPFPLRMKVGKYEGETFVEERETNRIIQDWWEESGRPANFTTRRDMSRNEAYWQAITSLVRDGGIIWQKYRGFPKNKFSYAVEPIEIDRLDHNYNRPAKGTDNEIQMGIEMDEFHAPIAFWILSRHPGDVFAWSNSPRYRVRVPAEEVIALFDIRSRAGQYIGMPRFASVIKRLHREDQWDVSYVTAAIYAACKQIYLIQKFDPNAPPTDYKGDETTELGEEVETVEPAVARILPRGYEPFQLDPKFPMESSAGFKKDNLRAIAAGTGLAYHTISQDLEGVTFSNIRSGENAQRDEFKKLQSHFIENLVRPDFNDRLKYAILSGELKLPLSRLEEFQRAAQFGAKRWPYLQPVQDAQADTLCIQNGLESRQRVVEESDRGGTFEDVCKEQASDEQMAELHGLEFGAEESPTRPGAAAPEETDDDDEAAAQPGKAPRKTAGPQTLKLFETNGHHRNGHSPAAR